MHAGLDTDPNFALKTVSGFDTQIIGLCIWFLPVLKKIQKLWNFFPTSVRNDTHNVAQNNKNQNHTWIHIHESKTLQLFFDVLMFLIVFFSFSWCFR